MPFGNGKGDHPERRRRDTSVPGGKREDDPGMEVAEQFGVWVVKVFIKHRIKLTTMLMMISAAGGALTTASLLAPRVTRLEKSVGVLQTDVTDIKQAERTKMYILCTLLSRIDPNAVQFADGCMKRSNNMTKSDHDKVWAALALMVNQPFMVGDQ
jgi:hypothetical protein